jgi:hypothetical protein
LRNRGFNGFPVGVPRTGGRGGGDPGQGHGEEQGQERAPQKAWRPSCFRGHFRQARPCGHLGRKGDPCGGAERETFHGKAGYPIRPYWEGFLSKILGCGFLGGGEWGRGVEGEIKIKNKIKNKSVGRTVRTTHDPRPTTHSNAAPLCTGWGEGASG